MANYRTPTLREILEGIEYEVWSDGVGPLEPEKKWYTYTYLEDWRNGEDILDELDYNRIRVKV